MLRIKVTSKLFECDAEVPEENAEEFLLCITNSFKIYQNEPNSLSQKSIQRNSFYLDPGLKNILEDFQVLYASEKTRILTKDYNDHLKVEITHI